MANYSCKKFSHTTKNLAATHSLETDKRMDNDDHANSLSVRADS